MHVFDLSLVEQIIYCAHTFTRNFRFRGDCTESEIGMIFEDHFRTTLAGKIPLQFISRKHDMGMGLGLQSRSGLAHELDVIAQQRNDLFLFELKYYFTATVTKEMVVVFLQKILDFYIENPLILAPLRVHAIFMVRSTVIPDAVRQFCALWGILLIDLQYYCPPMSSLVVRLAQAEQIDPATNAWAQPQRLHALAGRSEYLRIQMWRSITTTLYHHPADFEGTGLYLNTSRMPSRRIAAKWVMEQKELSRAITGLRDHLRARERMQLHGPALHGQ